MEHIKPLSLGLADIVLKLHTCYLQDKQNHEVLVMS